ncbi:hypothetical protein EYZ11_013134 [Aspergillus tanneri]|nr:hypothetical protein EYZ11_013134 [Aspergillus tanneri]
MTLHSLKDCSVDNEGFSGTLISSDCFYEAPTQHYNAGCSIDAPSNRSFGMGFNEEGGGVYAVEWTEIGIKMWFFPRGQIPSDLACGSESIDPKSWGRPTAMFKGKCDFPSHFGPQQIVINTAFCGDWAGQVWGTSDCARLGSTCEDYVANNPSAFTDAYWQIRSLKTYQRSKA